MLFPIDINTIIEKIDNEKIAFIDCGGLLKNFELGVLKYKLIDKFENICLVGYDKPNKNTKFFVFDEKNSIGSDVMINNKGTAIITIRNQTTLTEFRQAMYRLRGIYVKTIFQDFKIMYCDKDLKIILCNIDDKFDMLLYNEIIKSEKIKKLYDSNEIYNIEYNYKNKYDNIVEKENLWLDMYNNIKYMISNTDININADVNINKNKNIEINNDISLS
jgi:hypothetical protein